MKKVEKKPKKEIEFLPCPFCDCKTINLETNKLPGFWLKDGKRMALTNTKIRCNDCHAQIFVSSNHKEQLALSWNRRGGNFAQIKYRPVTGLTIDSRTKKR